MRFMPYPKEYHLKECTLAIIPSLIRIENFEDKNNSMVVEQAIKYISTDTLGTWENLNKYNPKNKMTDPNFIKKEY